MKEYTVSYDYHRMTPNLSEVTFLCVILDLQQDPWILSRCVVAWEGESETECFEVSDLNSKDTFIFKVSLMMLFFFCI